MKNINRMQESFIQFATCKYFKIIELITLENRVMYIRLI